MMRYRGSRNIRRWLLAEPDGVRGGRGAHAHTRLRASVRARAEPGIDKKSHMSITLVGSLCNVPAGPRSGMQRAGCVWLSPQVAACFLSFRLPPSFDPQLPLCTPVPRGPARYGARPRLLLGRRLPRGRVAALHAALGPGGLLDGRGLGRGALGLDAAPHTGSLDCGGLWMW